MVQVLQSQLKDAPLTTHNHLLAGALAGGVAATCTIPFDVGMLARSSRYHRRRCGRCRWLTPSSIALRPVKTRLQTQATLPKNEQRYTGVLQAFRTIYNEEGTHARLNACMNDRVSKRSTQQQYCTHQLARVRATGPIGFTRGLAPRIMYLMPAASLTFACYEAYKKLLLYLYTNA